MRIPKLISVSLKSDRFNLLFETGESRFFENSFLLENLNSTGIGPFDGSDLKRSIVADGILVFPSKTLEILTPEGGTKSVPYDLSPDFIYNASSSSDVSIGEAFKYLREGKKISQETIAQKCGTSKGYISKFESNKLQVEWNTLQKLFFMGLGIKLQPKMLATQFGASHYQGEYQVSSLTTIENKWHLRSRYRKDYGDQGLAAVVTGREFQPPQYNVATSEVFVVIGTTKWVKI